MMCPRHDERGVVAVMVLFVLAVAAFLVMEMTYGVRVEHAGSVWFRDMVHARWLAEGGLEWACARIRADGGTPDHFGEDWNKLSELSEAFSDAFRTGSVECSIEDETGKFPINALALVTDKDIEQGKGVAGVFLRLLDVLGRERGLQLDIKERREVLVRVKDWIDADTVRSAGGTGGTGPESADYTGVSPKYSPPNRPMRTLDELLLIPMPKKIGLALKSVLELDAVSRLFTVQDTGGKININTAPKALLMALVSDEKMREPFRDAVLEYRADPDNDLGGTWYRERDNMGNVAYAPMLPDCLGVMARVYFVRVEAHSGMAVRRLAAFVSRTGGRDGAPAVLWQQVS
ncbi:general secretion pathway protein K [Desulfobaculum xiamenense]|uniref:General secretion pathway protein K n=1 Tax=Desulfobaculum xiamenense TaxID=995050 RepID=A0A846QKW5_9BACT|nr:type II secretion system protein GspK [Desulfobaculum xiamenense]NJB68761.1 general secretion pathway protein K [Desulfobaculum xiamenense]